ncbi:MAG TPA: DUF169 domain-containing protein [Nitrospiria bacterium]|nr:DUF169 domain-containing protein [Nitrospiria bacterium]
MPNYASLAQTLTSILGLERPPVALAPVSEVPTGVPVFKGVSPSSCSFWRNAEKEVFAAKASDHMNCPIGAMVMGFDLTPDAKEALSRGLQMMCEVGYVQPSEAEHIPSLSKRGETMLYGPLSNFPIERAGAERHVDPEVVVIWIQPAQAMLLREATGEAEWKSDVSSRVFGRPACAALGVASRGSAVALSFGCSGMRTFTGAEPSTMLAAMSGRLLSTLEESLTRAHKANCAMQAFYDQQKTYFPFKKEGTKS